MKVIKGDTNDVELKALGDHRWDQYLGMESTAHQLNNLTLKDIMERLTQPEQEMLNDPFGFDDTSCKVERRYCYQYYQRVNSRFNLEGSNEDIDRLLQFFLFHGHDLSDFFNEIYYFTIEEGLLKLLDDKYLRQQVEDVAGYMIPKTLAPVLKTLLHKYGDLGGKESLSLGMKSINSTLLCIVIDKMCKTTVQDVTRDDLKHCLFYLKGIQNITGFKIDRFFYNYYNDFPMRAVLGFEAIKYEKDTSKNIDNKIATLEVELERLKKNRDKLKTQRSHKSSFMEECLSEASEWKQKYWGDKWF